jgi:hypothetical protein
MANRSHLNKAQFVDLYHGTSSDAADQIREEGMKPHPTWGVVYGSTDKKVAEHYARQREQQNPFGGAAVVKFRVNENKLTSVWGPPDSRAHQGKVPARQVKHVEHLMPADDY